MPDTTESWYRQTKVDLYSFSGDIMVFLYKSQVKYLGGWEEPWIPIWSSILGIWEYQLQKYNKYFIIIYFVKYCRHLGKIIRVIGSI